MKRIYSLTEVAKYLEIEASQINRAMHGTKILGEFSGKGYRSEFDEVAIEKIRKIVLLRKLGFIFKRIPELLDKWEENLPEIKEKVAHYYRRMDKIFSKEKSA